MVFCNKVGTCNVCLNYELAVPGEARHNTPKTGAVRLSDHHEIRKNFAQ
jgi:hypothetical protein